jgi:hypothetical protein
MMMMTMMMRDAPLAAVYGADAAKTQVETS